MIWLVIITAYDDNFTTLFMSCYFENLATLNIILATDKIQSSKGQLYIVYEGKAICCFVHTAVSQICLNL